MTQGDRIKLLRKTLNLTLEKFGEKLCVTKVAISNIENGHRNLTDQMLRAICREFNVNEEWLRTGEGEMFIALSKSDEISEFVGRVLKEESDSFKQRLIHVLSALDEEEWEMLERIAVELATRNE